MKKLSYYFLTFIFLCSCSTTKHIPENEHLLTKNIVYIDSVKSSNHKLSNLLLQNPNTKSLGLPLSLYFYNLGNPKGSKDVEEWREKHPKTYNTFSKLFSEKQSISVAKTFINFNQWFLKNGEAPVIIDNLKTKKTIRNLKTYYQTEGFFKAQILAKTDTLTKKKGTVTYNIKKGKPSFLDSVYTSIKSPILDSIYQKNINHIFLKKGDQYKDENFIKEANRIVKLFRNKGVYHFSENNILFEPDSLKGFEKIDVDVNISDRLIEQNGEYITKPFKVQKIKTVNVFTDYKYNLRNEKHNDSVNYKKTNFFAHDKLKYNPKFLSQSLFIKPNQLYTDSLRALTRAHLRGLKNFKSIGIRYNELNDNELEANVFLTPIEKYTIGVSTELSRSNIRNLDISAEFSLTNRNTFRGAEIFKLSFLGGYFNSGNGPGWEIGGNLSLEIPRFMAPFGLNRFVPKRMLPRTRFFTGISIQKNVALDKQNISVGLDYKWQHNKRKTIQLEIPNTQYIRNLNPDNYFNIYRSEYNKINEAAKKFYNDNNYNLSIPDQTISFMREASKSYSFKQNHSTLYTQNLNVLNRHNIITSDFLIPVIAFSYTYNNQENFKDTNFFYFRTRIANSGNIMGLLSNQKNANNKTTVFNIPIAQYSKLDFEIKKFWNLRHGAVLAHRTFLGAIISYNNSDIPFSKSYFAGGSNDIRGWKTYDLGPGARTPGLEYNIGSLKFLSSLEYRFNFIGSLKGALFVDVGNIWDITNSSLVDDNAKFKNFESIKNMAVAAGFGMRYDFKFLVARLDLGFKVREPYLIEDTWFKNFNFNNAVYNIGINYPF